MQLNTDALNDYRLHAITLLTGASAALSQVDSYSSYAPVAAGLACLLSASSYGQIMERVEDLVEDLEESGIISEETAEDIEEAIDAVEKLTDKE